MVSFLSPRPKMFALAVAALALTSTVAAAQSVQNAPNTLRQRFGQPTTAALLENTLQREGWRHVLGALIGSDTWRGPPMRAIDTFTQLDLYLIVSQHKDDDLSARVSETVWIIDDAVQMAGLDHSKVGMAVDCKVGTRGAWTPGLLAIVAYEDKSNDDGNSRLLGPAVAAWHMDNVTGRLEREELPVYCDDDGYGMEGE